MALDKTGLCFLNVVLPGSLTLSSVVTQLGGTFPVDTSDILTITDPTVTYVRGKDPFFDGTAMRMPGVRLTTGVSIPAIGIRNVPFTIPLTKDNDAVLDATITLEVSELRCEAHHRSLVCHTSSRHTTAWLGTLCNLLARRIMQPLSSVQTCNLCPPWESCATLLLNNKQPSYTFNLFHTLMSTASPAALNLWCWLPQLTVCTRVAVW